MKKKPKADVLFAVFNAQDVFQGFKAEPSIGDGQAFELTPQQVNAIRTREQRGEPALVATVFENQCLVSPR